MKKVTSQPRIACPLDPEFQPGVVFNRDYVETIEASGKGVPLVLGLERDNGLISHHERLVGHA